MTPLPSSPRLAEPFPPGSFRQELARSAKFWEPRRLLYNLVLSAVVIIWVIASWPHFRPMPVPNALLLLVVLALLANVCYTAAYFLELPVLHTPLRAFWIRWRWTVWVLGTLLAILFANYWIVDEIYPFVH